MRLKKLLFGVALATAIVAPSVSAGATGYDDGHGGRPQGTKTIAQIACVDNATSFSTLCSLLHLTGLDTVAASNDANITVFAPTNAAFTALFTANPTLPGVLTSPTQASQGYPLLKNVLLYHITAGSRYSKNLFKNHQKDVRMLNCGTITTNPNLTIIDESAQTITLDLPLVNISASNGVVHVINSVMLPKTTGCPSAEEGSQGHDEGSSSHHEG